MGICYNRNCNKQTSYAKTEELAIINWNTENLK